MGYQSRTYGQAYVPRPLHNHCLNSCISHTAERDAAVHLLSFFPDLPPEFTIDTYLTQRREQQDALWATVQPLPGVVKLIAHLHKHRVPIGVATGSQRRNFELKSAHLGPALFDHFEGHIVCADDGYVRPGRGKPHPDIFLATARMLGRDVGEGEEGEGRVTEAQRAERAKGLVFEDAISGLQAGKRMGAHGALLRVIQVDHGLTFLPFASCFRPRPQLGRPRWQRQLGRRRPREA